MKKTDFRKVIAREPHDVIAYYNRTGNRNSQGEMIFQKLTVLDFTSKSLSFKK